MSLSIRDTQAFTNVPNSRDIADLASLSETERLIVRSPELQNGAQAVTTPSIGVDSNDILLDSIQSGSKNATTLYFPYRPDLYLTHRLLFLGCLFGTASSIGINFSDISSNYQHARGLWNGTTSAETQADATTTTPLLASAVAASRYWNGYLDIRTKQYQNVSSPTGAPIAGEYPQWSYQHFGERHGHAWGYMTSGTPSFIKITCTYAITAGNILLYGTPINGQKSVALPRSS
jgi:hypothetical protein